MTRGCPFCGHPNADVEEVFGVLYVECLMCWKTEREKALRVPDLVRLMTVNLKKLKAQEAQRESR